MFECTIDFNLDDNWASIRPFVERLLPFLLHPVASPCSIDLRECRYLGPDAAALLAACHYLGAHRNARITIQLPSTPAKLDAFCSFSGLKTLIHNAGSPDPDHPRCETVPIQQFSRCMIQHADPLVALIRRHINLELDEEDYLRASISEVVQNVEDHAQSPIGGISAARFIASSSEVRVAIVDLGESILRTLQKARPEIGNSQTALGRVIRGDYSGQTLRRNRGLGISNLASHVRRMRGQLTILSGDAVAELRANRPHARIETLSWRFPGTAVFFTLGVQD